MVRPFVPGDRVEISCSDEQGTEQVATIEVTHVTALTDGSWRLEGVRPGSTRPRSITWVAIARSPEIPPMPTDWHPVLSPGAHRALGPLSLAERKRHWLREQGYTGWVDRRGNAVDIEQPREG
jgi:hypothetical protein